MSVAIEVLVNYWDNWALICLLYENKFIWVDREKFLIIFLKEIYTIVHLCCLLTCDIHLSKEIQMRLG